MFLYSQNNLAIIENELIRLSLSASNEKSPQRGRRQCKHTLLHPAVDEVMLTFLYFFLLIRTNGRTDGRTLLYIEAAHCLKRKGTFHSLTLK
jgi:hypothetical protein